MHFPVAEAVFLCECIIFLQYVGLHLQDSSGSFKDYLYKMLTLAFLKI